MISIADEQENRNRSEIYDIILISGDYYADHPHSGIGVIAKVLEQHGYSIGIIEKPDWTDFQSVLVFGLPRLFFGISSGHVDSMLQNYTPLKKPRSKDPYSPYHSQIPDRAVIVYSHLVKQAEKFARQHWSKNQLNHISTSSIPIVLGGVEASLRRFTHYDYWDNGLRKPIILDSKADILVYGPGEYQIVEIAHRIKTHQSLFGIEGTVINLDQDPTIDETQSIPFVTLPNFDVVSRDKKKFCEMHLLFTNQKNLYQQVHDRFIVQFQMHTYTQQELDTTFSLPFTYKIPVKYHALKMAQFSVITHRGCFGGCNFCSIKLHQGEKIISRSIDNILTEIEKMTHHPDFKGYIGDLGGPSANMYGMDCEQSPHCLNKCIDCPLRNNSHKLVTDLLKQARNIPSIKKIFVRSGIRYDLAVDDDEYLMELSTHHISGSLKIAPEHFSPEICALMNKPNDRFEEFKAKFDKINKCLQQSLKYYFITAHPGSTLKHAYELKEKLTTLGAQNTESIQIFTPTPMSLSTCMYYTGLDPYTMQSIYVPYTYSEKKKQKRILYNSSTGTQGMKKKKRSRSPSFKRITRI